MAFKKIEDRRINEIIDLLEQKTVICPVEV